MEVNSIVRVQIRMFARLIKQGVKGLDDVPDFLRELVEKELEVTPEYVPKEGEVEETNDSRG